MGVLLQRLRLRLLPPARKAYYRELRKVMDEADILLEVLDVRDPLGCRARAVERQFLATQQKSVSSSC